MENNKPMTEAEIRANISAKLTRYFGVSLDEATDDQLYKAVALSVKDVLTEKRSVFHNKVKKAHPKKVYYMCMEFLVGRQLRNNLMNLGLADE